MGTILIIGAEREYHAKYIFDQLQARGSDCVYLDTQAFPEHLKLNLMPTEGAGGGSLKMEDGRHIPLESVSSVYWRYRYNTEVSPEVPPEVVPIIYREIDSALGSLFRNMPNALWVNSVSAIERHRYKTHQLFLMAQAGIRVPDTLVSNDPEAVTRFYEAHHGNVIYKPVSGGAHTAKMTPEDLSEKRLSELRLSPVQFQEMIDGVDVRVYIIGEELFAAEIQAGTLDFRDDPRAPIVPVTLPEVVEAQCRTVARLFEYEFTGIDIRRTPNNEYCFIEGNPSPMFAHFENVTGYPISQSLMGLLESGKP